MSIKSSISDYLRIDELKENFLKLIEAKFELKKLEVQEKASDFVSDLVVKLIVGIFLLFTFMFANLIVGILLNDWLESKWIGYGILLLIYAICAGLVYLNSNKIKQTVRNKINENILESDI